MKANVMIAGFNFLVLFQSIVMLCFVVLSIERICSIIRANSGFKQDKFGDKK